MTSFVSSFYSNGAMHTPMNKPLFGASMVSIRGSVLSPIAAAGGIALHSMQSHATITMGRSRSPTTAQSSAVPLSSSPPLGLRAPPKEIMTNLSDDSGSEMGSPAVPVSDSLADHELLGPSWQPFSGGKSQRPRSRSKLSSESVLSYGDMTVLMGDVPETVLEAATSPGSTASGGSVGRGCVGGLWYFTWYDVGE